MRDGVCPKCGSDEIYKQETKNHYALQLQWLIFVHPMIYACADCGYCEQYIEDKRLPQIKTKWTPVNQKRKRKNDKL